MGKIIDRLFGDLLVEEGLSEGEQIEKALDIQTVQKKRIGEILLALGIIEESHIARVLSLQYGYPILTPKNIDIDEFLRTNLTEDLLRNNRIFPAGLLDKLLLCVTPDPAGRDICKALAQKGYDAHIFICTESEYEEAWANTLNRKSKGN